MEGRDSQNFWRKLSFFSSFPLLGCAGWCSRERLRGPPPGGPIGDLGKFTRGCHSGDRPRAVAPCSFLSPAHMNLDLRKFQNTRRSITFLLPPPQARGHWLGSNTSICAFDVRDAQSGSGASQSGSGSCPERIWRMLALSLSPLLMFETKE